MAKVKSPVRPYQIMVDENTNGAFVNRLLIGTATTGLIRMDWAQARFGQIIPMNWSNIVVTRWFGPWTPTVVPLGYMVADAQNLIVKSAIDNDMEWLLLHEHDVILPLDCFIKLNQYIRKADVPVVSGLYFSRSEPSDPLIFRGRGTGVYTDFKIGDEVWADGVPTGMLLIHMGIIREMWKDSEEYQVGNEFTRRVFESPVEAWNNPSETNYWTRTGTSDLNWCTRVMDEGYFAKAGWHEYQDKEYPFLVDTSLFCLHQDIGTGVKYPPEHTIQRYHG